MNFLFLFLLFLLLLLLLFVLCVWVGVCVGGCGCDLQTSILNKLGHKSVENCRNVSIPFFFIGTMVLYPGAPLTHGETSIVLYTYSGERERER